MKEKEGFMDRAASLLPISIVTKITQLTARQVRYYEQQGLIRPTRTTGKQRLFSLNEIDQLLQIKELIGKGINIAGVKEMLEVTPQKTVCREKETTELSEERLREILKRELINPTRSGLPHLTHGELSRFFQKNLR